MNNDLSTCGDLILSRDASFLDSESDSFRRAAARGELTRVRRGVYTAAEAWVTASDRDRYLRRIHAVVATRETPCMVSHQSAAALWAFPRIGSWPHDVHLLSPAAGGVHSRNGVRLHREALPPHDVSQALGLAVTSRLRTLVDLARSDPFTEAVAALDHALNPKTSKPHPVVTQDDLLSQLERTRSSRGVARAARAIAFASDRSDSPGESFSRVLIHRLGFVAPELQRPHANPRGGHYYADFEWPGAKIIGEFDGRGKYLKKEYLGTLSPGEAVFREKVREDDLRHEGSAVVRWTWEYLRDPERFRALLTSAGVPRRSRRAPSARGSDTSARERQVRRAFSPAPVALAGKGAE